jgi:N-acetylneuraminic acid mutarotase
MRRATVVLIALAACTASGGSDVTTPAPSTTSAPAEGWVEVAPDPMPRSEHPAVVLDGEMVVSGGFVESGFGDDAVTDAVGAYDPARDTWREMPPLPSPRHHGMAAVVGDRLFVIGGYAMTGFDPTSSLWELVGGEWVERAPMPTVVGAGAAVELDGSVYVVGGTPEGAFFRYDPQTDTWERLPDPSEQREHLAAVTLDGEIWALAGRWEGQIFASTEIFDPATGEWRPGPAFNEARSGFGAAVIDDAIWAVGGEVFDPNRALSSTETLSGGEWSLGEPFPYGIHGNPLVQIDGTLYLPGGSTQAAGVENDGRTFRLTPD